MEYHAKKPIETFDWGFLILGRHFCKIVYFVVGLICYLVEGTNQDPG